MSGERPSNQERYPLETFKEKLKSLATEFELPFDEADEDKIRKVYPSVSVILPTVKDEGVRRKLLGNVLTYVFLDYLGAKTDKFKALKDAGFTILPNELLSDNSAFFSVLKLFLILEEVGKTADAVLSSQETVFSLGFFKEELKALTKEFELPFDKADEDKIRKVYPSVSVILPTVKDEGVRRKLLGNALAYVFLDYLRTTTDKFKALKDAGFTILPEVSSFDDSVAGLAQRLFFLLEEVEEAADEVLSSQETMYFLETFKEKLKALAKEFELPFDKADEDKIEEVYPLVSVILPTVKDEGVRRKLLGNALAYVFLDYLRANTDKFKALKDAGFTELLEASSFDDSVADPAQKLFFLLEEVEEAAAYIPGQPKKEKKQLLKEDFEARFETFGVDVKDPFVVDFIGRAVGVVQELAKNLGIEGDVPKLKTLVLSLSIYLLSRPNFKDKALTETVSGFEAYLKESKRTFLRILEKVISSLTSIIDALAASNKSEYLASFRDTLSFLAGISSSLSSFKEELESNSVKGPAVGPEHQEADGPAVAPEPQETEDFSKPNQDLPGEEESVGDFSNRLNWSLADYKNFLWTNPTKPPLEMAFPGDVNAVTELKYRIEREAGEGLKGVLNFWVALQEAKFDTYPEQVEDSMSSNIDKLKKTYDKGFTPEAFLELFASETYGPVFYKIMALIEMCIDNRLLRGLENFSYVDNEGNVIVAPGQFNSIRLDQQETAFLEAIKKIVELEGWTAELPQENPFEADIKEEIVEMAFDIMKVLGIREHFFVCQGTTTSVTNGFSKSHHWMNLSASTLYGIQRYGLKVTPEGLLLTVVDPSERFRIESSRAAHVDRSGKVSRSKLRTTLKERPNLLDSLSAAHRTAVENFAEGRTPVLDEESFMAFVRACAESRIKRDRELINETREWFSGFLTVKPLKKLRIKIFKDFLDSSNPNPFRLVGDRLVFDGDSNSFPSPYEFFMRHLPKADSSLAVVSGEIKDLEALRRSDFKLPEKPSFQQTSQYNTALTGWEAIVEALEETPIPKISSEDVISKIGAWFRAIGKIKIIPGPHHNVISFLTFIYFVKVFKWMDPKDSDGFGSALNTIYAQVDTVKGVDGQGIPYHIKLLVKWLLTGKKPTESMKPSRLFKIDYWLLLKAQYPSTKQVIVEEESKLPQEVSTTVRLLRKVRIWSREVPFGKEETRKQPLGPFNLTRKVKVDK